MSMRNKKIMNIFFILELAIVLFIVNVVIASYNSREMLYRPYKNIFNKSGYYFTMQNGIVNDKEHISLSFEKLKGDLSFMTIYETTPRIGENSWVRLVICPDEFYSELRLPLKKGKYTASEAVYGIISANPSGIKTSDTLRLYDIDAEIKICGELTDPTYRPKLGDWFINSDVRLFYQNYALSSGEDPMIIMPFSSFENIGMVSDDFWALGAFIYYNTEPTSEIYQYNREILSAELLFDLYEINANTKIYLNNDLKKYFPIAMLIFFIAIMGLICNIAIHILEQMKTLGIYYLCGMRWRNALKICFSDIMILLFVSVSLMVIVIAVFCISGLSAHYGTVFRANNLFVTAAMTVISFIFSAVIPTLSVIKQSPADLLRRNKE